MVRPKGSGHTIAPPLLDRPLDIGRACIASVQRYTYKYSRRSSIPWTCKVKSTKSCPARLVATHRYVPLSANATDRITSCRPALRTSTLLPWRGSIGLPSVSQTTRGAGTPVTGQSNIWVVLTTVFEMTSTPAWFTDGVTTNKTHWRMYALAHNRGTGGAQAQRLAGLTNPALFLFKPGFRCLLPV